MPLYTAYSDIAQTNDVRRWDCLDHESEAGQTQTVCLTVLGAACQNRVMEHPIWSSWVAET